MKVNGYEFESTPGVGDGQGGLACHDSWGRTKGRGKSIEEGAELLGSSRGACLALWQQDSGPDQTSVKATPGLARDDP